MQLDVAHNVTSIAVIVVMVLDCCDQKDTGSILVVAVTFSMEARMVQACLLQIIVHIKEPQMVKIFAALWHGLPQNTILDSRFAT